MVKAIHKLLIHPVVAKWVTTPLSLHQKTKVIHKLKRNSMPLESMHSILGVKAEVKQQMINEANYKFLDASDNSTLIPDIEFISNSYMLLFCSVTDSNLFTVDPALGNSRANNI